MVIAGLAMAIGAVLVTCASVGLGGGVSFSIGLVFFGYGVGFLAGLEDEL